MRVQTFRAMLAALVCLHLACPTVQAADTWVPLRDKTLSVLGDGNPLDLSSLVEQGPAGRHGWAVPSRDGRITFERSRTPIRLLAASVVFSTLNGGVPAREAAELMVEQLRRTGYGAVRFHFVDAHLMTGRDRDFDFDPEQFDRLHYLMARLKEAGIYWVVDGLTSDNGGYGGVYPHRYVKKFNAKVDALVTDAGFGHWATLVERLWGAKNPYTGIAPIKDPAMLGMILVNEGGIGFMATLGGQRIPPVLESPFRDWLKQRYGNDAAWRTAWRADARGEESLEGRIALPERVRGKGARDVDFARFVVATEQKAFRRMEAHVRSLGFNGMTTAFDSWGFLNADLSRSALGWVDMHSYQSLPSAHGDTGSRMDQTSVHQNVARFARELSNARQWGKPFTVSEYGQPFWSQFRHEAVALIPTMAAHQGWDMICQFAETPWQADYGPSAFRRRQAIYPFGIGADPIARAGERLAAMLFVRGDVAPAKGRLRFHVNAERALERSAGWEQLPEALSRLAFTTGVGLDFGPVPKASTRGELSVDVTGSAPNWQRQLESVISKARDEVPTETLEALRAAAIVGPRNATLSADRLYQSDTEQLTVDSRRRLILVDSPRTAVIVMQGGSAGSATLAVKEADGPVLIAVSSLDGEAIAASRRMLMWVLTDAQNTGMQFESGERTVLRALGAFPPLVRTVRSDVTISRPGARAVRVWPLSLAGERRTAIAGRVERDGIAVRIDTAALSEGPALFFEIQVDPK